MDEFRGFPFLYGQLVSSALDLCGLTHAVSVMYVGMTTPYRLLPK